MTFASKKTALASLLILSLILMHDFYDSDAGYGGICVNAAPNRKVVVAMAEKYTAQRVRRALHDSIEALLRNKKKKKMTAALDSELRRAPSGPDPVHHHGENPKPRSLP